MTRRLLFAAALLLVSAAASAQELAIFDINDFVDPRELGAVPASFGRFGCPCSTVLVTRVTTGWDHDFMNVTQATGSDVGFGQLATSVYRGPWQLNVKAAAMRDVHKPAADDSIALAESLAFPRNFFALQLAYYLRGPGSTSFRTQLSWRGTHYHETVADRNGQTAMSIREYFGQEFGAEVDTQAKLFGRAISGSVIYTTLAQTPGSRLLHNRSRLAYVQRFPRIGLLGIRIDPSLTAGVLGQGLKFSSAGRLDVQPKLAFSVPLRVGGSVLNFVYGPHAQRLKPSLPAPKGGDSIFLNESSSESNWHTHHEAAVFIDLPLLVRSH